MIADGKYLTALWYDGESESVLYIDQTLLPHQLIIRKMITFEDGLCAIRWLEVRGAPLIGVAGAFALWLGMRESAGRGAPEERFNTLAERLLATRPTAINLARGIRELKHDLHSETLLLQRAITFREEEIERCRRIGMNGVPIIRALAHKKSDGVVNILTHCNAGWLACVDYGTALAPIYLAHNEGIKVHVWVDETRPLNQGSRLTAYELKEHGVPCTVITDNAGGLLMQRGEVDLVIVGADRITRNGDVANKTGTYLKALAAFDNGIPFYVAAPETTFDYELETGSQVPIEERHGNELQVETPDVAVRNPAFDITPARLITGYLTDKQTL